MLPVQRSQVKTSETCKQHTVCFKYATQGSFLVKHEQEMIKKKKKSDGLIPDLCYFQCCSCFFFSKIRS